MSDNGRGLPLLSGPPPPSDSQNAEIACRKCNKEFNMIFARARKCGHCGFSYCHSCSDYQALMPRTGVETGYDAMNVCAYCIEFLTITAAGRSALKALPLAKMKKYINAYNIKADRAVEKDDLIDAIIAARGSNGCLPPSNENFYRKYSVPNKAPGRPRGIFSRSGQASNGPPPAPPRPAPSSRGEFARPDLAPDNTPPPQSYPPRQPYSQPTPQPQYNPPPQQPHYNPPPHPPPQHQQYNPPPHPPPRPQSAYSNGPPPANNPPPHFHTPPPRPPASDSGHPPYHGYGYQQQAPPAPNPYSRPPPQQQPYRPRQPPRETRPAPSQPQAGPAPAPPPPQSRPRAPSATPPPSLDQLLNMTHAAIGSLSIGALKEILFTNHVNAGLILEKGDLVAKVVSLVGDEKRERERQRQAEEREEMERAQREEELRREREERIQRERDQYEREEREAADGEPSEESSMDGRDHSPHRGEHESSFTSSSPPKAAPAAAPPKAQGSASTLERTGLCVICQDEEANIAIVDCGHMAMCRACSELIMSSSRECPLCRTRIVTEARLLRIFKT